MHEVAKPFTILNSLLSKRIIHEAHPTPITKKWIGVGCRKLTFGTKLARENTKYQCNRYGTRVLLPKREIAYSLPGSNKINNAPINTAIN